MSNANITVVIPTFNRARLITRALNSICTQQLPPARVIVVDNNSSDNTLEVLSEYSSRPLPFEMTILSETRPGAAVARNRGLQEVKTPYVMFYDSDDTMRPEHIRKVMDGFLSGEMPDMICFRMNIIFENESTMITKFPDKHPITDHIVNSCFATEAVAMTTELARRSGGWDEELTVWDDLEYGLRLVLNARRLMPLNYIATDVFHQSESQTGNDFTSRKGRWEKALNKMEAQIEATSDSQKTKWKRWITYRRVILEAIYARENPSNHPQLLTHLKKLTQNLPKVHRHALRLIYEYTRRGGRGAYYFYRLLNGR